MIKELIARTYLAMNATITTRAHGIDISKYDKVFDPTNVTGQLDFVIQRASYRATKDELFDQLNVGVQKVPIRGAYHYLNSDTNWKIQADKFLSVVSGKLFHFYVCDLEEAANVISTAFAYMAWQWIEYVKQQSGLPVLLYTSPNVYNLIVKPSESKYNINWNTVDLWQAQWLYTPDPNKNPSAISGRTAPWRIWQYTNSGPGYSYGVGRSIVDLDVFNGTVPDMKSYLGISANAPESWFNGAVTYANGWMTGISGNYFKYHITKIEKARVDKLFVTDSPLHPRTTKYVAETRKVDVLSNGGEAIYTSDPALPKGQSVAEGVPAPLAPPIERFLSMQFDSNKNFIGFLVDKNPSCYWAVGISDKLLENGVVPDVFDTEEADPRSTLFWNDTHWMLIHIDGRNNGTPGCRLREVADLARGLGMKFGGNLDGGDSSTLVYLSDGTAITKNNPPEGYQHALADHFGFILNDGGTTVPSEQWKGTALKKIAVFPEAKLSGHIRGARKKGFVATGTLAQDATYLFLKIDTGKFLPVRTLDGTTEKCMTLEPVTPPPAGNLWRVKLDQETDRWNFQVRGAAPAPAVWVLSATAFVFDRAAQFFAADILSFSKYGKKFSELSSTEKAFIASAFTGVFRSDAAFMNKTGFACPKFPTERRNYIKYANPDPALPLPRKDKIRVCSDARITGVVDGTDLVVDHFTSIPTSYNISILDDPRVFRATIIKTDGTLINFPQLKDGTPVYIPIISNNELRIPLKFVEKVA